MSNQEIEKLIKREGIYKWQIAKKIGLHETSFIRWFREELSEDKKLMVLSAIEELKLDRLKQK